MQDFITRQRLDERSRLQLTFTYADNTRVVVSTRAEGALHDLNYPEMHRAKERKPFNRMSQSKNPLAQPLIYTSSASEATGTADSIHTFACPPLIRSLSFHPCVKVRLSRDKRDIDASRLLSITGDYEQVADRRRAFGKCRDARTKAYDARNGVKYIQNA